MLRDFNRIRKGFGLVRRWPKSINCMSLQSCSENFQLSFPTSSKCRGDPSDTAQCPKVEDGADHAAEIRQPEKVWSLPVGKAIPMGNALAKTETPN